MESPRTKGDLAYRRLRDRILAGELGPGEVIPQRELAAEIGISTTPLREGLRRLESEGLITLDAHKTARVAVLRAEEARDLYELRRALDPMAASLAAERRSARDLEAIRAAGLDLHALPVGASVDQLIAHRQFHAAIYRASHNGLLIATLDSLWDKADRYRMMALSVDRGQPARDRKDEEHRLLVEYIAAGDRDNAARVMLAHIDSSLALSAIERLDAGAAGVRGGQASPKPPSAQA